ncbi:MAG TPA: WG repeat-containing protein, partial [Bacteroidia bacterium]|nr:WG repeat-containing protein [Bacteroidia bacterium]
MMRNWRNTIACFLLLSVSLTAQVQGLVQIAPNTWTNNPRPVFVPWMPVKVNRLWGFADTAGHIKIKPQFDAVEPFNGGFAVIQKGNKAYVIDSSGTIVTPNGHDQIQQLEDSVFATYKNTSENGEGGWGAEKYGGKEILAPRYDRITRISYFVFACHADSGMGFFHRNGTLLTRAIYDTGYVFTPRYITLVSGNNYGVISLSGARVLPDSCEMIKILSPTVVAGKKKSGWGANNESGRNVIPFAYDSVGALGNRFAIAEKNDTVHLYAVSAGPSKVDGNYINATPYGAFWLKGYTAEKKCALIDTSGRIIIPALYDDILFAGNGNWIVIKNKMWGVCDSSGKIIVPLNYTFIQPFRQGMSVVSSGILQGLINAKGEVLVNPAQCVITIKGNIAKVMRPNAKAEFVKTDGNGNVTSRDEYEDVRTIKIGARPNPVPLPRGGGSGPISGNGLLTIAPRGDSLAWFLDAELGLYGMMDMYLGDTLIKPSFTFITRMGRGLTLVGICDTFQSVAIDGQILQSGVRVGLIEDTTGKMIIRAEYTYLTPYNFAISRDSMLFRCCRRDGASGLVTADGKERFIPASYVGNLIGGVAPFCVGGKWEMNA